jgi:lipopolysaccharide export system permease protein
LKTLHGYLLRQVLASLVMTVAVFTFVLLLGNVLREILTFLINRQASLGLAAEAMGLLIPYVWVFSLPMGMLTACLLVFGRFSADQELMAARASGISLLSMASPVIFLSLALCLLSAWLNMEIAPRCRVGYHGLIDKVRLELAKAELPEDTFVTIKDYIFYVGQNDNGNLKDVMVFQLRHETNVFVSIQAPRGKVEMDVPNQSMQVHLFEASTLFEDETPAIGDITMTVPLAPTRKSGSDRKVGDMTFSQLMDTWRDLESRIELQPSLKGLTTEQLRDQKKALIKRRDDLTSPIRYQMHRQVAFSFACFGFTLIGIPLGIQVHRRETNIGMAIALILAAVYYSFIIVAEGFDQRPEYAPHLIVWLPNFIFQSAGAVLLWRANRR